MYREADLPQPHMGEWSAMHHDPERAINPNAWRGRMDPDQPLPVTLDGASRIIEGGRNKIIPAGNKAPGR